MPEDKPKVPEVNLLPGEELESRPGGLFLKWALTWGRRIVVTVELVVILAFLSRFWLDTEVANLTEQIDQKKVIVESESAFEQKFRAVSERMTKAKEIEGLASPLTVYDRVQSLIPVTVFVSRLSVNSQSVSLVASADEASLGELVNVFKKALDFTSVSVEQVSRQSGAASVNFAVSAKTTTQNL